ncbi:response regulator transcription factor [Pedobacter deserti]|uniref:response regulator transcription factor n=1 Tax=Pedobacter deserti TaxID=2817382 RepID=UPI00210B314C|nr:helix-turn-helix transcriptional regulator [Pedobacter sp. SYSU D00382]
MNVFNSEMHVLTLIIVAMELIFFGFQLWYYYAWPQDKSRLWYLVLLGLLIVYNLTGGLFPDPDITWLSVRLQNIIAYGSGFLTASYFPYYFYRAFELDSLRFQAIFGVPLFLLGPYLLFFGLVYALNGNLDLAIKYGLVVPFFYSLYLFYAITRAIGRRLKAVDKMSVPHSALEAKAVYFAMSPWVCMTVFAYLQISQWVEVLVTNTGFIIITILFMLRSGRFQRMEHERLLVLEAIGENQEMSFEEACRMYGLTRREAEVAELLCRGKTYREIAEALFIAERTVGVHVRNIFSKTRVNKRFDLVEQLRFRA